jgi:hypothetical protein
VSSSVPSFVYYQGMLKTSKIGQDYFMVKWKLQRLCQMTGSDGNKNVFSFKIESVPFLLAYTASIWYAGILPMFWAVVLIEDGFILLVIFVCITDIYSYYTNTQS